MLDISNMAGGRMNQDREDDLKPWNEREKKMSFIATPSPQLITKVIRCEAINPFASSLGSRRLC